MDYSIDAKINIKFSKEWLETKLGKDVVAKLEAEGSIFDDGAATIEELKNADIYTEEFQEAYLKDYDDSFGVITETEDPSLTSENKFTTEEAAGKEVISDKEAKLVAERLYKALEKYHTLGFLPFGTDEDVLKEVFTEYSGKDLLKIEEAYGQISSKSLRDALKADLSFGTESTYLALLDGAQAQAANENQPLTKEDCEMIAEQLYESMKGGNKGFFWEGWGTDESKLSSIISSYSPEDMKNIMEAFENKYGTSLKEMVKSEMGGDKGELLIAKLEEAENAEASKLADSSEVSDRTVKLYVNKLNSAMKGLGTDEQAVQEVMSLPQEVLVKVFEEYERQHGEGSLEEHIKGDFSFGTENTYLGILQGVENSQFNTEELTNSEATAVADLIHDTMDIVGTDEFELARYLTEYSTSDLHKITEAYNDKYGDLESDVKNEMGGDKGEAVLKIIERAEEYEPEEIEKTA